MAPIDTAELAVLLDAATAPHGPGATPESKVFARRDLQASATLLAREVLRLASEQAATLAANQALVAEVARLTGQIGAVKALANELSWGNRSRAISQRILSALAPSA